MPNGEIFRHLSVYSDAISSNTSTINTDRRPNTNIQPHIYNTKMTQDLIWKSIRVDPRELSISRVLRCGQSFRWKFVDGIWSCTLRNRIVLLKQVDDHLHFSSLPAKTMIGSDETENLIKDYFNLNVPLVKLYKEWCSRDPKFVAKAESFGGIRMLRQDPWENLVSFICSTNNNVKRISKMCDNLCVNYGEYIGTYQDIDHYAFPRPQALSGSHIETELRELGFGYRAKFIQKTSAMLTDEKEFEDLYSMRDLSKSSEEVHNYLIRFQGVGPKVADCVALMSLDRADVVPVDTHVFQFAIRDYKFRNMSIKAKTTITKDLYIDIKAFFRELWGDYAGWAHSVLFAADLRDLENGVNIDSTAVKSESPTKTVKRTQRDELVKEEEVEKKFEPTQSEIDRAERAKKRRF